MEAPEELITWINMDKLNYEDVKKLSKVFDNTTATYKFYWMLGILDVVNDCGAHQPITFTEMVARMLGKAWQPLLQGNFSFGKFDKLLYNINRIIMFSPLNLYSFEDRILCYMMSNPHNTIVSDIVKKLTHNVPYRFLYPWIGTCYNSMAETLSRESERRCIYSIEGDRIRINPIWIDYLIVHRNILKGFTIHKLNCFLARRNPNFMLPMEMTGNPRYSFYSEHFTKSQRAVTFSE